MAIQHLVLITLFMYVGAQDLPPDIAQSLLTLMTEERTLRSQLESQADTLEQELHALKALRQNASCGCPQSAAPIAFSAVLTHNIAVFGKQQIIVFDEVNVNVGNGYDDRHGVFNAPVDGIYEFTTAVLVPAGKTAGVEIVHNQDVVAKTRAGDNGYLTMGTNVVDLKLSAGDEVFVRHIDQSDNNAINGEKITSFSGYLIEG